jgi:cysteine desulfurase
MTIYLDNNATTKIDPQVIAAMMPYLTDHYGNTASNHAFGWKSKNAVENARETIAKSIQCQADEIVFTSGTTESNNLVIKGLFYANGNQPFHIITQKTEHSCVLEAIRYLESCGCEVTYLDVDEFGQVSVHQVEQALQENTQLVSIMYANNEIGTIQPIDAIASMIKAKGSALLHVDAAQAVGKIPVQIGNIDFMSFSAHKIYGPKGIGALYINKKNPNASLIPLMHGGGHEDGLRSGTLNVAGIVGFAKALELCSNELEDESRRQEIMRDDFISRINDSIDWVSLNGHPTNRLSNNINFTFRFVDAGELMTAMPSLCVSSGSACASGKTEPSYVIRALGKDESYAKASLRISIGRFTTETELDEAFTELKETVADLRGKSLEYEMFIKNLA